MKKIIAFGVCSFLSVGGAFAQANVTVYGVLDTYMAYTNAGGKGSIASIDGGGYQANRVGFRGTEDLGSGLHANFQIENGFLSDSGAAADNARLFNRQSWVGLAGGFGEVRVGRQNSAGFQMIAKLDAFSAATYGSFLNNVSFYNPRYDNVIGYFSPTFNGFHVDTYYSLGEQTTNKSGMSTYMLGLGYDRGPLSLSFSSSGQESANGSQMTRSTLAGGSYDYGAGKIFLGYYRGNNFGSVPASNVAGTYFSAFSLSANYRLSPAATIGAGYGWANDSTAQNARARQISLIGTYDLSKRTMLYSSYAHLDNRNGATFSLSGAGPIPRNVPSPGGTVDGIQFGIRHLF